MEQKHMKIAGIVAEYNPFHNGHEWMINQLRAEGFGTIVCVMSGSFVQRGEAALYPAHVRAKAALVGGVDLVLRLPSPYAAATAERFAAASAGMLAALGCVDTLAFGAETPDTAPLRQVAQLLYSPGFAQAVKQELGRGVSFAVARAAAAEALLPGAGQLLQTSNNILGVEYCKALYKSVPEALAAVAGEKDLPNMPDVLALPRRGALHDGEPLEEIASASWLRRQTWAQGSVQALDGWVPQACAPVYKNAQQEGRQINLARYRFAVLARLRGKSAAAFAPYAGHAAEGLDKRMAAAAAKAVDLPELHNLAKTKRFAHSRIRRAALAAALEFPAVLPDIPPFIQVLGANAKGLALLKRAKGTALLPVSTSLAKLAQTSPEAGRLVQAEAYAEDFYALCQQKPEGGGRVFTQPAVFIK